ncbi:(p)ppGpp synthetase, RelA/SpoT family [Desulfocapsa sulfexigens DSM 10523]|uniref:(P)ppGpp synthetase, RelA/SpoT family n=1 Tax=Desulfocapsa sulfexigens (strain DSM 10523 / SB164P1) TaxID=1167006 RepID=M1PQF6_DESSD|nr:bifunctional (p)ppGpp synthetase/guanosine-3',5'-bis(diphosphate) 3'-pyrophosphohydrolase [Desulfocapsa sulfexigens]AGF78631.1 (p)ppGpp synthetase, RelA/SpoT family [Desulfocapsa sulfexigens DSM 10523]
MVDSEKNDFMVSQDGLKILTRTYLNGMDLSPIDKAWDLVVATHSDKQHFSGTPYLDHTLHVASTLASMHLDLDTIVAGLLHGVLKEGVELDELRKQFGENVAIIVDGCTRITNVHYNSKLTHQADNVRKMLLAIATDVRVLLVKLADRLQDMCLLDTVPLERQQEIARETKDLYAPLASRLGIDWMKRELEDLAFQYLHPSEYLDLVTNLESSLEERQRYVDEVISIFHEKLAASNIEPTRIIGRPKHLYSIYKKLVAQKIPLERVYDKVAFRIIVDSIKDCYEALGVIHANWSPVPGRIKDFISVPKSNNYQSMHTTVIGPRDHFIEIQIRTEEMDRIAMEGVAAHWAYKEGQNASASDTRLFTELKSLVKTLQEVDDPREFLESVHGELDTPEVYALTPAGEVKELPTDSSPIDFAYAIHTEVGDHCIGAKVNGKLVPLKYMIQNGDIIEIVTSKNQRPRRGWLELVKTSRARSRVRSWLRREDREKALNLGREICEKELKNYDTTLKKMVKSGHVKLLLRDLHCNSLEDMLAKVGSGTITIPHLIKTLQPPEIRREEEERRLSESGHVGDTQTAVSPERKKLIPGSAIHIDGIDDMMIKISRCCNPVPGDPIIGFITNGRGISVHKAECANLLATDSQRWMDVEWSSHQDSGHRVEIQVSAENSKGIFAAISSVISADDADIVEITAKTTPADTADLHIAVEVEGLEHLQRVLQHLRQIEQVITARRV